MGCLELHTNQLQTRNTVNMGVHETLKQPVGVYLMTLPSKARIIYSQTPDKPADFVFDPKMRSSDIQEMLENKIARARL